MRSVSVADPVQTNLAADSRIRRMLLAAQRLSAPSRELFDRIYIGGEKESDVRQSLDLSAEDFAHRQKTMLRTLICATQ